MCGKNIEDLVSKQLWFFLILTWGQFFSMFLERQEGRERETLLWERHINRLSSCTHPDWGLNPQPEHVSCRELNQWPFGPRDNAPTNLGTPARALSNFEVKKDFHLSNRPRFFSFFFFLKWSQVVNQPTDTHPELLYARHWAGHRGDKHNLFHPEPYSRRAKTIFLSELWDQVDCIQIFTLSLNRWVAFGRLLNFYAIQFLIL